MNSEGYDQLETRDPDERERDVFGRLPDFIALALSAPGWVTHLAGIDPNAVTSRAELAKLPLVRKSEFAARQKADPPWRDLKRHHLAHQTFVSVDHLDTQIHHAVAAMNHERMPSPCPKLQMAA